MCLFAIYLSSLAIDFPWLLQLAKLHALQRILNIFSKYSHKLTEFFWQRRQGVILLQSALLISVKWKPTGVIYLCRTLYTATLAAVIRRPLPRWSTCPLFALRSSTVGKLALISCLLCVESISLRFDFLFCCGLKVLIFALICFDFCASSLPFFSRFVFMPEPIMFGVF